MIASIRLSRLFAAASSALLLTLAFLLPLHLPPWPTFHNEFLVAMAILLLASGHLLRTPRLLPAFHLIWGAIFVMTCLQAILGVVALDSVLIVAVYAFIALLAFYVGTQHRVELKIHWVLWPLAIAAILSALVASFQWVGAVDKGDWDPAFFFPHPGGGRTTSNIAQANNFGTLLIVGLWSCLFLLQAKSKPACVPWLAQGLASVAMFGLVLGIYLSGSRTAVLNLLLAPIFVSVWLLWRQRPLSSPLLAWSSAPIILLVIFQIVMPWISATLDLHQPPESRPLTSDSTRLRLWSMAFAASLESPWLGQGLTGMAEAHLRLSPVYGSFDYKIAGHAHNTVLDLLIMFGIPIGGAIVVGVAWLWWRAWRATQEPAQLMVWLMCTAMLVHALLEYPLHYGFFLWLLCLMFGYLLGKQGRPLELVMRRQALVSTFLILLSAAIAYPFWRGYIEVEKLYTLLRQQGAGAAHQAWQQAHPLSRAFYPALLERLRWISRPTADMASLTEHELRALIQATHSYPLPGLLWRATLAYAYRSDAERAAWYGQRLCSMFDPRLCETAAKEWPNYGKNRTNWPYLPWQAWHDAPLPGRQL